MLKIRYNLFYGLKQEQVYQAYEQFWIERGYQLVKGRLQRRVDFEEFVLYRSDGIWTLLEWSGGWEWKLRRQAQLYVSDVLQCPGLLVFVDDGAYWGYELFSKGQAIDHFVQDPDASTTWFPDNDCRGKPERFVEQFPWLSLKATHLASYLVQQPSLKRAKTSRVYEITRDRLNVPPTGRGHQFSRFDECAVLDFLRFLGLRIESRNNYVIPLASPWQVFKIVDSNGLVFGDKEVV